MFALFCFIGLSKVNLRDMSHFTNESTEILIKFLGTLKTPLCFVSHNGDEFDFPVLYHHLQNYGKVNYCTIYTGT